MMPLTRSVLVVEDDYNKLEQLSGFLEAQLPKDLEIVRTRSYRSGLQAVVNLRPHIIILDMTLPTFDISPGVEGGRIRFFAGREILHELKRRRIGSKVIVVTQFESFGNGHNVMNLDQLRAQMEVEFAGLYVSTVFYQSGEGRWRDLLGKALIEILAVRSEGDLR